MRWFDNLKIRSKLFFVFGILVAIIVAFSVFSVLQINRIRGDVDKLIDSYQMRQSLGAGSFSMRILREFSTAEPVGQAEFTGLIARARANYEKNIDAFMKNLLAFRATVLIDPLFSEAERKRCLAVVDATVDLSAKYWEVIRNFEAAVDSGDKQKAIRILWEDGHVGSEFADKIQDLRELLAHTVYLKTSETTANVGYAIILISGIAVALVFLSVVALVFTIHNINRPISKLEKAIAEISKGNLAYPIRSERKDELGVLSNCIGDMVDAITAANAASVTKSIFLANMSHEIRTPMNAILGITEIQLRDEALAPNMREALGTIYNSGDLLLGIINNILDLSKIEAGKLELTPAEYDVASLIYDTATLNMMHIGSKPIEFELLVDENTPSMLFGDELRIKQILNNLLSNAFKYTKEGRVKLSISVERSNDSEESDVTLVLRVNDTGLGMTEEQVRVLFDEYTRFNLETSQVEGTGLGMSITQNLVDLMGGVISVKSEVGRGTEFIARLPQKNAGSDVGVLGREVAENFGKFRIDGVKQIKRAQVVFEPMPYGNVLIVDDVESNLYVAKGLMSPYELSIDTVMSGFEAIDKVRDGKVYDIVFMDHMMPKMDGIETVKIMREQGYAQPIVALTANAVVGQSDVFLANGFDGFISKPIDVRHLNAVLKKFIRDKQPPEVLEAARRQSGKKDGKQEHIADGAQCSSIDPQLVEIFVRDAAKSIAALEAIYEKRDAYEDEDIRTYTINVHSMRSVLASIGEPELSSLAAKLEHAGRERDTSLMSAETGAFLDGLRAIVGKFAPPEEEGEDTEITAQDQLYLREKLLVLQEACSSYDKKTAKDAIAELRQKAWPRQIKEQLGTIAEHLLHSDFEKAAEVAEEILIV
jgi:signal transduction histidine kinase/CheY-like chemotaxis protein/HPt (histidine-containing phosphotransfer) domain-containing protein